MSRYLALGGAGLVAVVLAGCANGPFWYQPRSLEYQRSEAQRFDPYAEDEVGPPVVGGRPREFAEPVAEPSRARWNQGLWEQRHGGGY